MQNNWYVITGAPSSGKTTTVNILAKKGYKVVHEAARIYIDQELANGKTIKQIRKNELKFQHDIIKIKLEAEKNLNKKDLIFFDRAIPDSTAYYDLWDVKHDRILMQSLKNSSYKKAFLLKSHRFLNDYARIESEEQAIQLEFLLEKSYLKLKIPTVIVPVMSVDERVKFILNAL